MPVTITVPRKITAAFVVATDHEPENVPAAIDQAVPGSLAATVADRIGTPRLTIIGHTSTGSPWDLRRATGLDRRATARVHQARHHVGVLSELAVDDLPFGLHLARTVATAIAESFDGIPVDLDSGQALPALRCESSERFTLADTWIGALLPPNRDNGGCTAGVNAIDGCSCVNISTRGLRRFGLPELTISGVACAQDLAALNVLRTTAQHLLPVGTDPGEHTLPAEVDLTSTDFAAFWGTQEQMWDDGPIAVRLTQLAAHRLGVQPPDDFPGTLNEWLWDEVPPILHELLSCEADTAMPT